MHLKTLLGIAAVATLGSFLLTCPASAGTIQVTYTGPGSNTINLPGVGGVYSFPYYVSGAPMMCDDAQTDLQPPVTWWAQVNYLPANLTSMKWYSEFPTITASTALQAYEEAAIIFYDVATVGEVQDGVNGQTPTYSTTSGGAEGNVAVWYLFSPGAVTPDSETLSILQYAQNAVANGHDALGNSAAYIYSQVVFITPSTNTALNPNGINQSQEFIALGSEVQDAPEPATYALFGAGLLALGCLGRRLRRA